MLKKDQDRLFYVHIIVKSYFEILSKPVYTLNPPQLTRGEDWNHIFVKNKQGPRPCPPLHPKPTQV